MSKAEKLVLLSDASSAEVLLVKQSLQDLGFSETDQAWLVEPLLSVQTAWGPDG